MAALVAAAAAWLSLATIGFETAGGARVGILPLDAWSVLVPLAAAALVLAAAWRTGTALRVLAAVTPLALVFLPWLPFRVPAAFLIWNGPIVSLAWVATAAALPWASSDYWTWVNRNPPRRQALQAAVLSFALFSAAAWSASAAIPGGDEPHYLVITQSLLYDHDLAIENNHRRGDYHAYFAGDLRPDFNQRGRNGEIYSIHAPGLPAIILPAFAIGGYHAVVIFLMAVASAACALAWWLAWRVTGSAGAAWFGWAAIALSAPCLLETFTVYPDGFGAAVVLTGVWALLRADWERESDAVSLRPWLWHGVALAMLPWLHTRFAVIAAALGGLILVRLARSPNAVAKAIAFLTVPALSALTWLFFFVAIYGTPDPSAPYGGQTQNSFAYLANGLGGLLLDQGFGLFATAPVLIVAVAGLARVKRFALEWTLVCAPYVLAVATFAMWWAGWSAPARFLVPVLLPLAIPAAAAWQGSTSRGARAVMLGALFVSAWLSCVMVAGAGGRLGFHSRNEGGMTAAPWVEWAAPLVDLSSALPAFVPLPAGTPVEARNAAARSGMLAALPWIALFAVIAWGVRRARRDAHPSLLIGASAAAAGVATMVAASIVWHATGADPVTVARSQLEALRAVSSGHAAVFDLTGRRRLSPAQFASSTLIDVPVRDTARRGARANRPLALLPAIPAGEYQLSVRAIADEGWIMAGVAQDQFAIVTQPLGVMRGGVRLRFPVDVRSIVIRADDEARDEVESVRLNPLRLFSAPERATTTMARRAVRYGGVNVFFLDDRAFVEPGGFWVGGGRDTTFVIAPDADVAQVPVVLRNAPVANVVRVESGAMTEDLSLGPGEERRLDVPVDAVRRSALVHIRSAAGFRPSEGDPRSRDTRYLGVYVKLP